MNQQTIFLCYRQDDGKLAANALFDALNGQTLFPPAGFHGDPITVNVYLDRASPAVADWRRLRGEALERAAALVVLCTPGVKHEFDGVDECYFEIRWWLEQRTQIPPIIVTTQPGNRWIPDILKQRWPRAQLVTLTTEPNGQFPNNIDFAMSNLRAGLEMILFSATVTDSRSTCDSNFPGLYVWQKDRQLRYIGCNENYARAAGFDSPHAMIGKTDDDMPWRSLAEFFRQGDRRVMTIPHQFRMQVPEKEIMVDRVADILVTESPLPDPFGRCVGVGGYFIDVTGHRLVPDDTLQVTGQNGVPLGRQFGDTCFSIEEVSVFRHLMKLQDIGQIAAFLRVGTREVLRHLNSIKAKLQSRTISDVVMTAMRAGLPLTLYGTHRLTRTAQGAS